MVVEAPRLTARRGPQLTAALCLRRLDVTVWTFTAMAIVAALLILALRFFVPEWMAAIIVGALCIAGGLILAREQRTKV